ncbi:CHAT domain-containing protein [Streptomyces poriferorum]|uniref:CHAT domain-containing protein n=1 Tax=Streptomyces poriferorum TaxID=2798799 RepID=A0ABY9IFS8_9ACTN|nr:MULTISPECIES: CHAT domain-containing protein [unclassified Streptomyces]MDP5315594.1 CHAT domain-containing protein [Streptomyces sp. Alt4]WLQ53970.1 CHAT domain-containing protein [Streptomyces sp. Alt2]
MSDTDYLPELAASLADQASQLVSLKRYEEALTSSTDACRFYLRLADGSSRGVSRAAARAYTTHTLIEARLNGLDDARGSARRAVRAWQLVEKETHTDARVGRTEQSRLLLTIAALQVLSAAPHAALTTLAKASRPLRPNPNGTRLPRVSYRRMRVRLALVRALALAESGRLGEAQACVMQAKEELAATEDSGRWSLADRATRTAVQEIAGHGLQQHIGAAVVLAAVEAVLSDIIRGYEPDVMPEESARLHRTLSHGEPGPGMVSLLSAQVAEATRLSAHSRSEELAEAIGQVRETATTLAERGEVQHRRQAARILLRLGQRLWDHLDNLSNRSAVDQVVEVFTLAWRNAGTSAEETVLRHTAAVRLATVLLARFEKQTNLEDLERALGLLSKVADGTQDPELRVVTALLSSQGLNRRYELLQTPEDLDRAVAFGMRALEEAEDSRLLSDVGLTYFRRYGHSGSQHDLDAAISLVRRSLGATERQQDRADHLTTLGYVLTARYNRTGERNDLDEAIAVLHAAMTDRQSMPPVEYDTHAETRTQHGLANALLRRVQESPDTAKSLADIDEAIALWKHVTRALPRGAAPLREAHTGLGRALALRHECTGGTPELRDAVDHWRTSISLLPPSDPQLPSGLAELADLIRQLHAQSGEAQLLGEAVTTAEAAVSARSADENQHAAALALLARVLGTRNFIDPHPDDMRRALSLARGAAALLPTSHPAHDQYADLHQQLLLMSARQGANSAQYADNDHPGEGDGVNQLELSETLESLHLLATAAETFPMERLSAAQRLAGLARDSGDLQQAMNGYTTALDLLHLALATRSSEPVSRVDSQHREQELDWDDDLSTLEELVADAVACALELDDGESAVCLMEQGRAALFSHFPGPDHLLDEIRADAPALAAKFRTLCGLLADSTGLSSDRRRELAVEWERLSLRIRALPRAQKMLRAPRLRELFEQAVAGPLVMINVSNRRCDALIITPHSVLTVPLPGLRADLRKQVKRFQAVLGRGYAPLSDRLTAEETLRSVLAWLWETVTQPVLNSLGPSGEERADGGQGRLWWIPGGLLGLLPLHATVAPGHGRSDNSAMPDHLDLDRICHSYAVTVRSLAAARKQSSPLVAPVSALVVSPAGRPSTPPLSAAAREAESVAMFLGHGTRQLSGQEATTEAVSALLPRASLLHLSCHGVMQPGPRRAGSLVLADGELSATALRNAQPRNPVLVMVSACETDRTLRNGPPGIHASWEALSLPAVLQLGGYRHAIGTLWEVDDRSHADFSEFFYKALNATGHIDPDRSAQALHTAQNRLRQRYPHIPSLWAAHIHVGP